MKTYYGFGCTVLQNCLHMRHPSLLHWRSTEELTNCLPNCSNDLFNRFLHALRANCSCLEVSFDNNQLSAIEMLHGKSQSLVLRQMKLNGIGVEGAIFHNWVLPNCMTLRRGRHFFGAIGTKSFNLNSRRLVLKRKLQAFLRCRRKIIELPMEATWRHSFV